MARDTPCLHYALLSASDHPWTLFESANIWFCPLCRKKFANGNEDFSRVECFIIDFLECRWIILRLVCIVKSSDVLVKNILF